MEKLKYTDLETGESRRVISEGQEEQADGGEIKYQITRPSEMEGNLSSVLQHRQGLEFTTTCLNNCNRREELEGSKETGGKC